MGKAVPVLKNDDRKLPSNYKSHLINLLLERVIFSQVHHVISDLEENNFFFFFLQSPARFLKRIFVLNATFRDYT